MTAGDTVDELLSLRASLVQQESLCGKTDLVSAPATPGELSSGVVEALTITPAPSGAATITASATTAATPHGKGPTVDLLLGPKHAVVRGRTPATCLAFHHVLE
ncbi:MAG: hypothetical protein ABIQ18_34205 [Umezawaea sp.]